MSLDVRGSFDLGKIRRAPRQAAQAGGIAEAMEHIRGIAAPRTPVETGHLVGSAEIGVDVDKMEGSLLYPGPYARYQEKTLDLKHETGQALFLESSLNDGAKEALDIYERSVKRAM